MKYTQHYYIQHTYVYIMSIEWKGNDDIRIYDDK